MAVPTLTPNSPVNGSFSWNAFNIRYNNASYNVSAGSTSGIFVVWIYNGGAPFLQAYNSLPTTLTADDLLLFLNKNGTPVNALNTIVLEGSLIVEESILTQSLSANCVTSEKVLAGEIDTFHLKAGSITAELLETVLTLSTYIVAGSPTGSRVVLQPEGLFVVNSAGAVVTQLLATGSSKFRGIIEADQMIVYDNFQMRGVSNELAAGTQLVMAGGTTTPKVQPSATIYWDGVDTWWNPSEDAFSIASYGLTWDSVDTRYAVAAYMHFNTPQLRFFEEDGVYAGAVTIPGSSDFEPRGGVTYLGGHYYVLGRVPNGSSYDWQIRKVLISAWPNLTPTLVATFNMPGTYSATEMPGIGTDETNLLVGYYSGTTLMIARYSTAGSLVSTLNAGTGPDGARPVASILGGDQIQGMIPGTGMRYVVTHRTGQKIAWAYSYLSTTAAGREPYFDFPLANALLSRGMVYRGDGVTSFRSMDNSGHMHRYSRTAWTTESDLWGASYCWFDSVGTTHQSAISLRTVFTMQKRAYLTLTAPDIPVAGAEDPNSVKFYLARGAGSTDWRLNPTTAPVVGARTVTITEATFASATPVAANFPAGATSQIVTAFGEVLLSSDGIVKEMPPSHCAKLGSAAQSIPDSVSTQVSLGNVQEATPAGLSGTNSIVTNKAGLWLIEGVTGLANSGTGSGVGRREMEVRKNGSLLFDDVFATPSGARICTQKTSVRRLASGDTLTLWYWQNSGVAKSLNAGECYLRATFLGP